MSMGEMGGEPLLSRERSAPPILSQRSPELRLVLATGAFIWVVIAMVVTLTARSGWDDMVARVSSTAATVSRLLADHSDRLLINADLVRHQAVRLVGDTGPLIVDRTVHDDLRNLIDISPNIVSVWVGDAEGTAVLTTREFPAPNLSAADREYFTAVRDDPDRLFIGNLLDNRYPAEALLINTSRRMTGPNGDMRGFVQVSLDPAPINETFQQVDLGFDASLWWIGPDGRALIREPALPAAELDERAPPGFRDWPTKSTEGQEYDAAQAGRSLMGVSGVDGGARLFFWSDAPLYGSRIIVGVSYDEMVAQWRTQMAPVFGFAMIIGLASMVILWLLHRARTRDLAYAAQLEDDVLERTRDLDRALEQKDLILQELVHRVRNAFATVLALTRQMLRTSETLEEFRQEFPGRLEALARTQLLLVGAEDHGRARISDLAHAALAPYHMAEAQISISGPSTELSSEVAFGVGLILHELVTNALKHGSLSEEGGSVSVHWTVDAAGTRLEWRERDGPTVVTPTDHGSGTKIIERATALIGGDIVRKFNPDGVRVELFIPSFPAPS
jgi:two-component sensor histidine kinase